MSNPNHSLQSLYFYLFWFSVRSSTKVVCTPSVITLSRYTRDYNHSSPRPSGLTPRTYQTEPSRTVPHVGPLLLESIWSLPVPFPLQIRFFCLGIRVSGPPSAVLLLHILTPTPVPLRVSRTSHFTRTTVLRPYTSRLLTTLYSKVHMCPPPLV